MLSDPKELSIQVQEERKKEMTDEQKTTQEDQNVTFDVVSCMSMMEKMMSQHWEGCDCSEMMSQFTDQGGIPEEWMKVMSQMMDFHCGPKGEAETSTQEA